MAGFPTTGVEVPRIPEHGNDRINRACNALMRLADRVYAGDLTRKDGCRALVHQMEVLIMRGDYDASQYNPYQVLADRLKADFPEVWRGDQHNSGQRLLEPWGVS